MTNNLAAGGDFIKLNFSGGGYSASGNGSSTNVVHPGTVGVSTPSNFYRLRVD